VAPRAADIDKKGEFPWDLKQIFQDMGLMGLSVPEEYGGFYRGHNLRLPGRGRDRQGLRQLSLIVQVQSLGWEPILIGGSEEQKKKYGPSIASGEKLAPSASPNRAPGVRCRGP